MSNLVFTNNHNVPKLFSKITAWAKDRNLIKGSTSKKQAMKLLSEVGELSFSLTENKASDIDDQILMLQVTVGKLADNILKGRDVSQDFENLIFQIDTVEGLIDHNESLTVGFPDYLTEEKEQTTVIDDIGDCKTLLTIIAEQNDLTVQQCLDHAYNDIKHRKGQMIDGVFVKESDLQGSDNEPK